MEAGSNFWHRDPEVLGGALSFVGTRVHVKTLFDFLADGESLEEFLENFPTVSREAAIQAIKEAASLAEDAVPLHAA